ncbi:hypothetical protein [Absidia glauca]|uniref:Uncharacterized protein n=1 Tax=Absidia glauca TaxID=4829 RepID=A0A168LUX7_ABSGL|nr:hypothetical protein [Absidia glauca]
MSSQQAQVKQLISTVETMSKYMKKEFLYLKEQVALSNANISPSTDKAMIPRPRQTPNKAAILKTIEEDLLDDTIQTKNGKKKVNLVAGENEDDEDANDDNDDTDLDELDEELDEEHQDELDQFKICPLTSIPWLKHGTLYIYKMYHKHYGSALMPALRVMEHIVESVDQYSHLLECESDKTATEYDYLGCLWMPLFRRLINDLTIRLKSGESTYHYSTKNKQDLYFDASRVNGFKIDLRLLTDANNTEYDICSMEVCCDDKNDGKIVNDEGKLNREMKDDLDCTIDLGLQPDECCSWGVQVSGSSCLIMSTHLIDNGLYAVIPRFELSLPSSLADLKVFMETMDKLLIFRHLFFFL